MTTETRIRPRQRNLDVDGSVEGSIQVQRTRYGSEPETVFQDKIFVPVFPTATGYVGVKAKETINTGDYNSVSVEVTVSLPVLPEASEMERVYNLLSDTVERWMDHEIKRATDPNWEKPQ